MRRNVEFFAAILAVLMGGCSVPKSSHPDMYWTERNYWPGQNTHPAFYLTCRSNQKEMVVVDEFQFDHTWFATISNTAFEFPSKKEAVRWAEEVVERSQLCRKVVSRGTPESESK